MNISGSIDLKAGSLSRCALRNEKSSLLLSLLLGNSLHCAKNEAWKTPLVLSRFFCTEACSFSVRELWPTPHYASGPHGGFSSLSFWKVSQSWNYNKRKVRHHYFSFFYRLLIIMFSNTVNDKLTVYLLHQVPFGFGFKNIYFGRNSLQREGNNQSSKMTEFLSSKKVCMCV